MLYIWGSGGDRVVAASAGSRECAVCNSVQPFELVVDYRYFHVWYLLSWVTSRKHAFACTRCGNGTPAERAEYAPLLQKDPIPFLRRRGWTLPLLAAAPTLAFAFVVSGQHAQEVKSLLAAPQVGDVYSVDLGLVADSMQGQSPAWGEIKLVAIDGTRRHFVVAEHGWDRKSDLRKEQRKGLIYEDDYYDEDDELDLEQHQLETLHASGTLFDVHRKP